MTGERGAPTPFDTERLDEMRAILGQAATERLLRALAAELAEAPYAIVALARSGQHAAAAAAAHRLRGAVVGLGLDRIVEILTGIETAHGDLQNDFVREVVGAADQARDAIRVLCVRSPE